MRTCIADNDQADIVADEGGQFLVLQHCRCGQEQVRFIRIVDMGFDFVAALGAKIAHQRIQDVQRIEILALLRNLVLEGFAKCLERVLDGLGRVGHDKAADTGAADDHQLERLVEHLEVPAHRHVAAQDTAEGNNKTNDHIHVSQPAAIVPWSPSPTARALCEAESGPFLKAHLTPSASHKHDAPIWNG